jgi:hypothetical protein
MEERMEAERISKILRKVAVVSGTYPLFGCVADSRLRLAMTA